jgi:hypothetical protein
MPSMPMRQKQHNPGLRTDSSPKLPNAAAHDPGDVDSGAESTPNRVCFKFRWEDKPLTCEYIDLSDSGQSQALWVILKRAVKRGKRTIDPSTHFLRLTSRIDPEDEDPYVLGLDEESLYASWQGVIDWIGAKREIVAIIEHDVTSDHEPGG